MCNYFSDTVLFGSSSGSFQREICRACNFQQPCMIGGLYFDNMVEIDDRPNNNTCAFYFTGTERASCL